MKRFILYMVLSVMTLWGCTTTIEGVDATDVLAVSANQINMESDGGKAEFEVNSMCDWEIANSTQSWFRLSVNQGGKGTKKISITIDKNEYPKERSATITVENALYNLSYDIVVSQKGTTPFVDVSEEDIEMSVDGGSKSITINSNFNYTITSSQSWCKTDIPNGGFGEQKLNITIEPNRQAEKTRTATITLESCEYNITKEIKITQAPFVPELSVSASELSASVEGGAKSVEIDSNISWSATCSADWVTLSPKSGVSGKTTLAITIEANYAVDERNTAVKITNSDYNITREIKVVQTKFVPELSVSASELTETVEGGTKSVEIDANISWSATCSADWITLSPKSGVSGKTTLAITVGANATANERTAIIYVANNEYGVFKEVAITQDHISMEISEDMISVRGDGGTSQIKIISNISWQANCSADWVTLSPANGNKGETILNITIASTLKTEIRTSVVNIFNTAYQVSRGVNIEQNSIVDPNSTILYTSSDGKVVTPYSKTSFGANMLSNTYENGQGIIIFDASITSIGGSAFYDCSSLTSVTIPDSVTSIGKYAFEDCTSLTSVTIGNGVTSIGGRAFYGCNSLTSVTIPDSVTSIGSSAFYGCRGELIINSKIVETNYTSSNYPSYDSNGWLYKAKFTKLTIGDNITKIGNYAFNGCTSLTSVTIPDSVTSIGDLAFFGCSSLTAFYGKYASSDNRCLIVDGVLNSFAIGCGVASYTIPNSVISIGANAFRNCTSLTSVTIGNGVTSIGDCAFVGCSSLTSITIPNSVTSIGDGAFSGCSSLTSVHISDISAWCKIVFEESSFSYHDPAYYVTANPLRYAKNLYLNGELITELTIPDSVTSIGEFAFCHYSSLTSVTIPDSVTSIGTRAFYHCSNLLSVTIPESVVFIGFEAFYTGGGINDVYCKSTIPPSTGFFFTRENDEGYWGGFGIYSGEDYGDNFKIYVPRNSVEAYKAASGWDEYSWHIVGYDF